MSYEESPDEKRLKIYEEKIAQLEEAIDNAKKIIARHEKVDKELTEINVIIDGLFKKAQKLSKEDSEKSSEMPKTDEEWEAWQKRTERIQDIYSKIADLSIEFNEAVAHAETIEKELEQLWQEAKKITT